MKIKKLLLNYLQITKQVVLEWQQEVEKARLQGDDYFRVEEDNARRLWHERIRSKSKSMSSIVDDIVARMPREKRAELSQQFKQERSQEKYVEDAKKRFAAKNEQIDELKSFLLNNWELSKTQPVRIDSSQHLWHISGDFSYQNLWLYQDAIYGIDGTYIDDEQKLLILEYSDRERRKFEQLKNKFSGKNSSDEVKYERTRIPEDVRIAVWRRDQGRCARCGSRVNLEYDHIVPVSKGGTNTARNVELLCQDHNRSKGNRIE